MKAVKQEALLAIFKLIDADCGGSISKLELIGAVYRVLVWEIPWGGGSQVSPIMATHGVESSMDNCCPQSADVWSTWAEMRREKCRWNLSEGSQAFWICRECTWMHHFGRLVFPNSVATQLKKDGLDVLVIQYCKKRHRFDEVMRW